MKKHLQFYILLLALPLVGFIFLSNSNGTVAGVTGAPGDPLTCVDCHTNPGNFSTSLDITTDIAAGGYALGQTYSITVTQTSTGASKYGFEITSEVASNAKAGAFSTSDTNLQILSGGQFVTHKAAGTAQKSWTFNWTAPSTDVGAITFYAATIAADGTGNTNGDEMALATELIGSVLAINDARLLQFSMFPNPSDAQITLQLPTGVNQANVSVFDYLGKSLLQRNISASNNTIDISSLKAGLYFVRIQTDSKIGTKKLIVR